jgi:protein AroM
LDLNHCIGEIDNVAAILGVLTIGQTPRIDGLKEDVQQALGRDAIVVERGALDGLSQDELDSLRPEDDVYHMITMLSDGTAIKIAKQPILDRLQAQIDDLESNAMVDGTLLVCTGEFPAFRHAKPLLLPQAALYGVVTGIAGSERIGGMIPLESQRSQAYGKWKSIGFTDVALAAADPYCDEPLAAVRTAAVQLRHDGARVIFMDCFGYDARMRSVAKDAFCGPVILARSMAARIAAELVT